MLFAGIDLHKSTSTIAVLTEKGEILRRKKIETTPEAYRAFFSALPERPRAVIEPVSQWPVYYELLEELGCPVTLASPTKVKAIASAKVKTDAIDAKTLAELLRLDAVPASYIPPRDIRDLRELLRHRVSLVALRRQVKLKVHAILWKNGLRNEFTDLFGKGGRAWLMALDLREPFRAERDRYLTLYDDLTTLIREVEATINAQAEVDDDVRLLITMPGIGIFSAMLVKAEIGDVNRFPSPEKLAAYAGLVPSTYQSGSGPARHGRLTKQGSKWLRWIMVEAAQKYGKRSDRLGQYYRRIKAKHGAATAKVATARKMLRVIWGILRKREPYRDLPMLERDTRQKVIAS